MLKVLTHLELWIDGKRQIFNRGDDVTARLHPHDVERLLSQKVIEDTEATAVRASINESIDAMAARQFEQARQSALAAADSTRVVPKLDPDGLAGKGLSGEQLAAAGLTVGPMPKIDAPLNGGDGARDANGTDSALGESDSADATAQAPDDTSTTPSTARTAAPKRAASKGA